VDDVTPLPPALATIGARYDHTAIAGPSLAPLVAFWRDTMGGTFLYGEQLPIGAVTAVFALGDGKIELMAPSPGSTFFDRFFAATGGRGGPHHLTFAVADLDDALAVLDDRGIAYFGVHHDPRGIWSEVFVHPRDNGGTLVQLAAIGDFSSVITKSLDELLALAL
jgi:catechol 2,3-dioxygenase-like lactoylglutathione lyase family enzyme